MIRLIKWLMFIIAVVSFSAYKSLESKEDIIIGKMIYIPEGEFIMGSDDEKLKVYYDAFGFKARFQRKKVEGKRKVNLKGFYIDAHEVTNAQYKKFVDETNYPTPAHWDNKTKTYPKGQDLFPIYNVSWYDAGAYAKWAGKRLPTEEEWEKAARGVDGRLFPWGNKIIEKKMINTWETGKGEPQEVGENKYDVSPYGVRDMAGNLMEWTGTKYDYENVVTKGRNWEEISSGTEAVVKGGGWSTDIVEAKIPRKIFSPPDAVINAVGFRCAK